MDPEDRQTYSSEPGKRLFGGLRGQPSELPPPRGTLPPWGVGCRLVRGPRVLLELPHSNPWEFPRTEGRFQGKSPKPLFPSDLHFFPCFCYLLSIFSMLCLHPDPSLDGFYFVLPLCQYLSLWSFFVCPLCLFFLSVCSHLLISLCFQV